MGSVMKNTRLRSCAILLFTSLFLTASENTDWPRWRGINGDGRSDVTGIRKDWSEGLTKLWQVSDLCQGGEDPTTWSGPAIQGDKLVIPGRREDNDVVFCLNAKTGETIWKQEYSTTMGRRQGGGRYGTGSRATPAIDGDRVYTFGGWGHLTCWDLKTGDKQWQKHVEDEGGLSANFGYVSSPLVYKNMVIVLGGGTAMVIAFDKNTGDVVWKSSTDSWKGRPGYASPIIGHINGRDQIVLSTAGTTGAYRRRHPLGKVVGLEPESGKIIWEAPWWCSYEMFATPVLDGDTVILATGLRSGSMALHINESEATQIWENWGNDIMAPSHSPPIIFDGFIYGFSGHSSSYYERDRAGRELQCVDLKTGTLQWRDTDDPDWGTLVLVDGHLLCLTSTGKLMLVKPDPNKYLKVAQFQTGLKVADHPPKQQFVWTPPVVADGKVYVRYSEQLICYDLMPPL